MSYDLCLQKQAKNPYYIENIRTGIYTLEELCFYLYNNVYLIDDTIINEKLCDWVRDELGLTRLYRQLYEQLEKQENAAMFVLPIFREAGYLSHTGMREYQESLAKLEIQSVDMKQKLRGDYLVKEKMFARAVWEYRQILERKNPGKLGMQFYAGVWSNLGAAYAGLFRFQDAAECFKESYQLIQTKESFRKYISVLPLFLSEEAYRQKLTEMRADPYLIQKIQEHNAKVCTDPAFAKQIEQMGKQELSAVIEELKEEYCRSTKI